MPASPLALGSAGIARFNADAVTISVDFGAEGIVPTEHRSAARLAIAAMDVLPGSGDQQRFELMEIASDDFRTLMAVMHEREHYRSFISTPVGLFIWRLFQCTGVNVNFVCRLLTKYELTSGLTAPILDFAKSAGAGLVGDEARRPQIRDGAIVARVMRDGDALREVIDETETYTRCLNALLDDRTVTVGDFLELLNRTLAFAALRSDFPAHPTVTTRLDPHALLHSDGIYTLRELLEGAARLTEFSWVRGYPHWNPDTWRAQYCTGVYGTVFNAVHAHLGAIDIGRALIDLSLMAPIDPCFGPDHFLLEDLHPGHRFRRLLTETSRSVLRKSAIAQDLIAIEARCGLIPAHRVAGAMSQVPLVIYGRWGGTPGRSGLDSKVEDRHVLTTRFYQLMERKFHANLKLRAEHPALDLVGNDSKLRPRPDPSNAELSNFEVFNDYCRMNVYTAAESDEWLRFFHCLRAACLNTVHLALVTGVPATNLRRLADLALRRAAAESKSEADKKQALESLRSAFEIDALVGMFFGPAVADYVKDQLL
jgi:hypothetical protein